MVKEDDSELDAWRHRYPSAAVSWNLVGDPVLCQRYAGEAKNMLYQLKNRMNLAVPKLKSFQDARSPVPGITITVKSIYGQDFIEISTRRGWAGGGKEEEVLCTITFVDIPLSVQPMRHPGQIRGGEVERIDYIKTYYIFDVSKCPDCRQILWNLTFNYSTPPEARHYVDPETGKEDVDDHLVYRSLMNPSRGGEIISHGEDAGGKYIIWKAYTEGVDPHSRNGLGILLLRASIADSTLKEICSQQSKIAVDCCRKDVESRKAEIWWEGINVCNPFTFYAGKQLCKMPSEIDIADISFYSNLGHYLYAVPEVIGGCLPFEWSSNGGASFGPKDPYKTIVQYFGPSSPSCSQRFTIMVTDRCGNKGAVDVTPCCERTGGGPLTIGYTTLAMHCGEEQELSVSGGCGPFSWSIIDGAGSIEKLVESGELALFTAPSSNPNCANNPVIEVTDCCGATGQISIAVNCSNSPDIGYSLTYFVPSSGCNPLGGGYAQSGTFHNDHYRCDGALHSACSYGPGLFSFDNSTCTWECCWTAQCGGCDCSGGGNPCPCVSDGRTPAMKAAGCCPLNPLTGLPF